VENWRTNLNQERYAMKKLMTVVAAIVVVCGATAAMAEDKPEQEQPAVDSEAETRPDHDGDGIPNGQDPDWTGQEGTVGPGFVDSDKDGKCDRLEADEPCPAPAGRALRTDRAGNGQRPGWFGGRGRGRGFRFVERDGTAEQPPADTGSDCGRGRGLPPCGGGRR